MKAWWVPRPCARRRHPWSPRLSAAGKKSLKTVFEQQEYCRCENCGLGFVSHWRKESVQAAPSREWAEDMQTTGRLTWRAARSMASWPMWEEENEETRSSTERLMLRLMLEEPPPLSGARYINSLSPTPVRLRSVRSISTKLLSHQSLDQAYDCRYFINSDHHRHELHLITHSLIYFQTGSVSPQVYTNRGHILPLSTAIPSISIHYAWTMWRDMM